MFEKITLVELRVEDATLGGEMPDGDDDEMPGESLATESESDAGSRRSLAGRVRRVALLGAVVGAVVAVGAVARRVRGRRTDDVQERTDDVQEHEVDLEGEDDVELTA